jgi:hypothetical protein
LAVTLFPLTSGKGIASAFFGSSSCTEETKANELACGAMDEFKEATQGCNIIYLATENELNIYKNYVHRELPDYLKPVKGLVSVLKTAGILNNWKEILPYTSPKLDALNNLIFKKMSEREENIKEICQWIQQLYKGNF